MTYMLLDDAGNAINSYNDEAIAHAALRSIAAESPDTEIVLIEYGANGLALALQWVRRSPTTPRRSTTSRN